MTGVEGVGWYLFRRVIYTIYDIYTKRREN